jgi:hypothetical protein
MSDVAVLMLRCELVDAAAGELAVACGSAGAAMDEGRVELLVGNMLQWEEGPFADSLDTEPS